VASLSVQDGTTGTAIANLSSYSMAPSADASNTDSRTGSPVFVPFAEALDKSDNPKGCPDLFLLEGPTSLRWCDGMSPRNN
jgi:hypothetical protein